MFSSRSFIVSGVTFRSLVHFEFIFLKKLEIELPYDPAIPLVKNLPAMRETQIRSLGREDPLEKEMATHSSILAWRIPWTEEPGGF